MTTEFHQMQRFLSLLPILLPEFFVFFSTPLCLRCPPALSLSIYLQLSLQGLAKGSPLTQHNPSTETLTPSGQLKNKAHHPHSPCDCLKVTGLMTDMTSNPGKQATAAMPIWSQVSCMLHSVYDESAEIAAVKLPRSGPQP